MPALNYKEKSESIERYKKIVQACERWKKLYTKEESIAKAKEWNDIHNEGGEGFIPHFYTIDEYEYAKKKLEEFYNLCDEVRIWVA